MAAISRDRAIVLASLVAIAGLAWAYLVGLSTEMSGMDDMAGMAMSSAPAPFMLTGTMWAVMMIGMMLPSATPMILLFLMVQRKQGGQPVLATGAFGSGYLFIWVGFAVVAAGCKSGLGRWHSNAVASLGQHAASGVGTCWLLPMNSLRSRTAA